MDNLEGMDRFSEKFNFPRLNQEEIEIMNNPITSTKSEACIKNSSSPTPFPPQKQTNKQTNKQTENPGPHGFTGEFYQTFREELMPIILKLFQKVQRKEHFQTHSTRPPSL